MTPVSRAIARHMGVDLSPEGLAARNRRGIAIIVYGAPLTGKAVENKFSPGELNLFDCRRLL